MKKTLLILLLLTCGCDSAPNRAAASANLIVPSVQATQAQSLTLKVNGATVPAGGSYDYRNTVVQYSPMVTMGDGSVNQRVTYTSSAPDVATVNANGYLIANKAGQATITATSADDSRVSTTITVNVMAPTSSDTLATINTLKPITDVGQSGVNNSTNGSVGSTSGGSTAGSGGTASTGSSGGSTSTAPMTSATPRY